ncbi:MAG: ribonuclease Z [Cytophagales bacterium]
MIKITVLGSSSAMAAHGRFPSAQIMHHNNELILIDCGEGTQFKLQELKIKSHKINHILISHLHGDHFFGLIGLLSSMHLQGRTKELNIYAPPGLAELIRLQLKYSNSVLNYYINFHPLSEGKKELILSTKTLNIYSFPLNHRIACFGFRFDEKQSQLNIRKEKLNPEISAENIRSMKQGQDILKKDGTVKFFHRDYTYHKGEALSYAYCSDTRFDKSILNEIKNVDLLYHEATFLHELINRAEHTFHTTAKEAGKMANLAEVGKLMIGHFSTRYKDPDLLLEEAKEEFEKTILAIEGQTIAVTKP